jgi:S-methylmethionine-dependent homocysteine/selenocysteine methylase
VKSRSSFAEFIQNASTVLFPGGMGTELQRRGYKSALPLWSAAANIDAPGLVEQIHTDYLEAGASVAITNSFRTTPRAFAKAGREAEALGALKESVAIAMRAKRKAARRVFVGGSFAPLEDCYRPELVPAKDELRDEHRQLAAWLAEAGVDFLLAETINAGLEGQIMAEAASAAGLPFIVSFVVDSGAKLLDGTPIAEAVRNTDLPGRVGVCLNCRPIGTLDKAFGKLRRAYGGAIGLYPNGIGHAHDDLGWRFEQNEDGIAKFVASALRWRSAGAKIIGGCCGTTPAYIRALHLELQGATRRRSRPVLPHHNTSQPAHPRDLA